MQKHPIFTKTTLSVVLLLLTFLVHKNSLSAESTVLTVGGTGSGLGVMRLLAKSFITRNSDITVEVLPSLGSGGGIRALQEGAIDMAIVSRQINEPERLGNTIYYLGESPFIFAVHPETTVQNVSQMDIVNIYNGTLSTWPDGNSIRRIIRPYDDSDWQLMRHISPEVDTALEIAKNTEGLYLAITDTDAISYLERVPGSFGPTTLTMVLTEHRHVKILQFNGFQPYPATQKYPLNKAFSLLTKDTTSAPLARFVGFILSAEGQELITQAGIITDSAKLRDYEQ